MEKIETVLDDLLLSPRICFEIAKLLLETVFIQYDNNGSKRIENSVRKYLITDFYELLGKKQNEYLIELKDYSKNNEYHRQVQQRMKNIIILADDLNNKDFHDNIIYFMNILL
jgi:spore coat polysaccharide biosynthesis predicted glycosyltransferase SpsG